MSVLNQYALDLVGLKNQEYQYDFDVHDDFFKAIETDLVEKGNVKVHLRVRKSELMIQLDFHIHGTIELTCDRSLEPFDFPVEEKERLIIQFGDKDESLDNELEIISHNTQTLHLAQFIYEYIAMAIPFKKLHPKFAEEEDDESEVKLIYSSSTDEETEEEKPVDARWEALKKFSQN